MAAAGAQEIPETGGRVFGLVGGAFGDGNTTVLTSGGVGLRLTRQLGLDVEILYASDLGLPTDDDFVIQTFGVTFLTKMTVEFPVASGRV